MFSAVEIEINHDCNQRCSYCPNSVGVRKERGQMSLKTYTMIMHQLQELNFEGRISYEFFNEPMLHHEFSDIVRVTKRMLPKSKVVLYTNGTLLNKDNFYSLLDEGIDHFNVTKHMGVENYHFDEMYNKLPVKYKEKIRYLNYDEIYITNRGGIMNEIINNTSPVTPCYIPTRVIVITVKGNVLPCYEDFYQQNVMGNVNDSHIKDIWDSARYVRFRRDLRRCQRYKYITCKKCSRVSRDVHDDFMV